MSVLVGLSLMLYSVVRFLPLPVLYGLLFYLGVASLFGVKFVQRFKLLFIPNKYKPDYAYLRRVPNIRIHVYTIIQAALLLILCVAQAIPWLRVTFPAIIVGLMIVRWLLGFCFARNDLEVLDDSLPENLYCKKCTKKSSEKNLEEGSSNSDEVDCVVCEEPSATNDILSPSRISQRTERHSASEFNITQEVDKCDIWKTVVKDLDLPYSSPVRTAGDSSRPFITVTDAEKMEEATTLYSNCSPEDEVGVFPIVLGDSPLIDTDACTELMEQNRRTKSKACRKLFESTAV